MRRRNFIRGSALRRALVSAVFAVASFIFYRLRRPAHHAKRKIRRRTRPSRVRHSRVAVVARREPVRRGFGAGHRQFRGKRNFRCGARNRRPRDRNPGGCRRFRQAGASDRAPGRPRRQAPPGSGRRRRAAGEAALAPGAIAHRSGPGQQFNPDTVPEVLSAKANADSAVAQASLAEADAQRYENLLKTGDVSQSAYEKARTQADTAEAQANAARQQYEATLNAARQNYQGTASAQASLSGIQSRRARSRAKRSTIPSSARPSPATSARGPLPRANMSP